MATNTALEAQKYQFGQVYAASMAKMHPNHRCIPTKEKYDIMLDALKNKVANLKDKKCYRYIKDYIVVTVGDIDRIFARKHLPTQQGNGDIDISAVPRMCHEEELFDVIHDAHLSVGHGKAEKTYDYLKKRFSNVSRSVCDLFIKCCTCQTNVPRPARPADFKPIISKSFNCRGQVDLIDMQSQPDGDFKWIMHYQDHLTKFSYLRALLSKKAVEVAKELLNFFVTRYTVNITV